jgi:uncharacterized protein YdiU (UPF0061 family)
LDHSYSRLPEVLHRRVAPTRVREPKLVVLNRPLARTLGLDPEILHQPEHAPVFAGNALPEGADPLAQAYAGHQYGNFTPLGDGRAILLGEQLTPDGQRFDVQLKGAGPTPFSRRGDGRAALGPMLREYVISEAMQALGIPTTRSLAVATTGEAVMREQPLQGAVLTRIAASHIRVGTFEWAAGLGDHEALRALADHTLSRHFPECVGVEEPYLALFKSVAARQAALVAQWQHVGFVHGVMNTDNMALSGETIDYGPCAFMDAYDPATVFSSIDRHGRYAYGQQPRIAQWNLTRLAEAMLPLLHADETQAIDRAKGALQFFGEEFHRNWLAGIRSKLGLFTEEEADLDLAESLLAWMHRERRDFTNTFRDLATGKLDAVGVEQDADFQAWHAQWVARLARQPQTPVEVQETMRRHNPAVIPRNHKVEEALAAATARGDLSVMERLLSVLAHPYDPVGDVAEYTFPAAPGDRVYQTFCGT